jgi:hypothetical protein
LEEPVGIMMGFLYLRMIYNLFICGLVANSVEEIADMVQEEKALLEIMRKHCKK